MTTRETVQNVRHWSAVSFLADSEPGERGEGDIHDGRMVFSISAHTLDRVSFPRTAVSRGFRWTSPAISGRAIACIPFCFLQ